MCRKAEPLSLATMAPAARLMVLLTLCFNLAETKSGYVISLKDGYNAGNASRTLDGKNWFIGQEEIKSTFHPLMLMLEDEKVEHREWFVISGKLDTLDEHSSVFFLTYHSTGTQQAPLVLKFDYTHLILYTDDDDVLRYWDQFKHNLEFGKKFIFHIRFKSPNIYHIYVNYLYRKRFESFRPMTDVKELAVRLNAELDRVEWGGEPLTTPYFQTFPAWQEGRVVITGVSSNNFILGFINPTMHKPFSLDVKFIVHTHMHRATATAVHYHLVEGDSAIVSKPVPYLEDAIFEITILISPEKFKVFQNEVEVAILERQTVNAHANYSGLWVGPMDDLFNVVWC